MVVDNFVKFGDIQTAEAETTSGLKINRDFINIGHRLIEVEKLNIDLIDEINPFQKAYKVISRKLDVNSFRIIQKVIDETKYEITEEEVLANASKLKEFMNSNGRELDINSQDEYEQRLAYILKKIKSMKARRGK